jgi:hypothetical protein
VRVRSLSKLRLFSALFLYATQNNYSQASEINSSLPVNCISFIYMHEEVALSSPFSSDSLPAFGQPSVGNAQWLSTDVTKSLYFRNQYTTPSLVRSPSNTRVCEIAA